VLVAAPGCSAIHARRYEAKTPVLKIEDFFEGHVVGHGMIQNRSGEVTQRFVVDMNGRFENGKGVMDEVFVFDGGRTQTRQWRFTLTGDHTFLGTADDVTGNARCDQFGNAIHLRYVLQVPVGGKTYDIDMDDWLYAVDDRVLLNRTRMTKFGFSVGSVTATFVKQVSK
jgi:hypothetical protein